MITTGKRFWPREEIARYLVAYGLFRSGRPQEAHRLLEPAAVEVK